MLILKTQSYVFEFLSLYFESHRCGCVCIHTQGLKSWQIDQKKGKKYTYPYFTDRDLRQREMRHLPQVMQGVHSRNWKKVVWILPRALIPWPLYQGISTSKGKSSIDGWGKAVHGQLITLCLPFLSFPPVTSWPYSLNHEFLKNFVHSGNLYIDDK